MVIFKLDVVGFKDKKKWFTMFTSQRKPQVFDTLNALIRKKKVDTKANV